MSDLVFISPFFIVANLQDSVSFYVDKLGFGVQYIGPEEEPYFAMIGRGPVSLMLKSSGQPVPNQEYHAAGVVFSQPLQDDTDNLRGFKLADTDGYVLFFARPKA